VITYTCDSTVVQQFYQTRVIDEFVLRGNTATLKCLIPSFIADFVQVVEWVTDGGSFSASSTSDTDYGNRNVTLCFFVTLLILNIFLFTASHQLTFFPG
jgi:hypothetical protein